MLDLLVYDQEERLMRFISMQYFQSSTVRLYLHSPRYAESEMHGMQSDSHRFAAFTLIFPEWGYSAYPMLGVERAPF